MLDLTEKAENLDLEGEDEDSIRTKTYYDAFRFLIFPDISRTTTRNNGLKFTRLT